MAYSDEFNYRDCPWCKTKDIALVIINRTITLTDSKGTNREWTWLRCPRCASAISIETKFAANPATFLQVVPDRKDDVKVEHLPDNIKQYYGDAITALNAGIPSAAAVELRRTLEAAAKSHNVDERTLVKAVEKLVEKGLITKSFSTVLSHVRKIGNQGAHASDVQLSEPEVRLALSFTTQILRNLFEVPENLRMIQENPDEEQSEAEVGHDDIAG